MSRIRKLLEVMKTFNRLVFGGEGGSTRSVEVLRGPEEVARR
ncbi:MAG: hypothetical protein Q8P48_08015 [Deltaproteobacteria bacterium]|nr:hypothetical protein [Deltaproteobacteria bacterium]